MEFPGKSPTIVNNPSSESVAGLPGNGGALRASTHLTTGAIGRPGKSCVLIFDGQ